MEKEFGFLLAITLKIDGRGGETQSRPARRGGARVPPRLGYNHQFPLEVVCWR